MPKEEKDPKARPKGKDGKFLKADTEDNSIPPEIKTEPEEEKATGEQPEVVYFLCTWSTDLCLSFDGGKHERGHDGAMYETEPPTQAQFVEVRADLAQCGYFRAEGEEWIEMMRKRNADFEGRALLEFPDFEALVAATVKHNERLTLDNARLEQEAFDTESMPR